MAVAISFVCVLVALTVTPGIGSPAASTTRPVTVARNSCDHADGETRQARTRRICTPMRGEKLIISLLQRSLTPQYRCSGREREEKLLRAAASRSGQARRSDQRRQQLLAG